MTVPRHEIEPASSGIVVIERDMELSRIFLENLTDNYIDLSPEERERLERSAAYYKDLMKQTPPLEVSAEQVIVRGMESLAFRRREWQTSTTPARDIYQWVNDPNHPNGGSNQLVGCKPERKRRRLVEVGYSSEFAAVKISRAELIHAIQDAMGFWWRRERAGLAVAMALQDIRDWRWRPADGFILLRPRVGPFRVTPRNLGTNGNRYAVSRSSRPKDPAWRATYWQTDDIPEANSRLLS